MTPRRLFPEMNYPLPRFRDQYEEQVKLQLIAAKMEAYGVRVNIDTALRHAREAASRAEVFSQLFLELSGLDREALGKKGDGTTKAVKDWFKAAGAPDVVFDKNTGKAQLNAVALTCYASDFPGQAFAAPAAALLGLRKAKVNGRFANAYYEVASQYGGRIHFSLNPMGTKGTRWSASAKFRWLVDGEAEPREYSLNAQNVPKQKSSYDFGPGYGKLKLMVSLRDCFEPDPGCVWVTMDYEGAEGCLIAYWTQDALMMEWVGADADLHTENAKVMFQDAGIPVTLRKIDATEHPELFKYRVATKPATFGLCYQMPVKRKGKPAPLSEVYATLWKTWKQIFPDLTEVAFGIAIQRFWAAHTGVRGWQNGICDTVERDGYVVLPQTGRTLYVPPTAKGKNMSGNFFMQSGIGFLINRAMPLIEAQCDWQRSGTAILLQVHDELALQAPEARAEEFGLMAAHHMSQPADWGGHVAGVPAWPDTGANWGACTPIPKR